jgi:NTP pyrophosphatase (non-canonical NTP hydrolase)
MIADDITQLLNVVKAKIERDQKGTWSEGSNTYYKAMFDELAEVEAEIVSNRRCFLEDELGDVLWVLMCLLRNLEVEDKINMERVFKRALNKYEERVTGINAGKDWADIKQKQKNELEEELSSSYTMNNAAL